MKKAIQIPADPTKAYLLGWNQGFEDMRRKALELLNKKSV